MDKKYQLPNMEFSFDVKIKGEESGIMWVGKFRYRRPTVGERTAIDVMHTRLNGDLRNIASDVDYFNLAIAHLRHTLKEYPAWWSDSGFGAELHDANVTLEIYNKCQEFEKEWRNRVMGGEAKDVELGRDPVQNKNPEELGSQEL